MNVNKKMNVYCETTTSTMMIPQTNQDFYYTLSQVKQIISDNARSPRYPVSAQIKVCADNTDERYLRRRQTTPLSAKQRKQCQTFINKSSRCYHKMILDRKKQETNRMLCCNQYISFRWENTEAQWDLPPQKPCRRLSLKD
jgi:hypothetical protein